MITSRQVRAARVLLGWTQEALADRALVALTALKRVESEGGLPVRDATREAVRRALEKAGIAFITSGRHRGVILTLPETEADREEDSRRASAKEHAADGDQTRTRPARQRRAAR